MLIVLNLIILLHAFWATLIKNLNYCSLPIYK